MAPYWNCMNATFKNTAKMIEETYQVTFVILRAAENIKVGKHKLAEFLKGSKSKDVAYLSNEQGYGGLLWFNINEIIAISPTTGTK